MRTGVIRLQWTIRSALSLPRRDSDSLPSISEPENYAPCFIEVYVTILIKTQFFSYLELKATSGAVNVQ